MKFRFACAALVALGLTAGLPAQAADEGPPWLVAQHTLDATNADFHSQGIRGIATHVDDLEKALAGAKDAVLATHPATGTITVLTDGMADTIIGLASASLAAKKNGGNRDAIAVAILIP